MTQLKQTCQALLSKKSEEFDGLLHKKSIYNSNLGSIYDLEKIQGALTPTPEACSKPLPSDLNESLTKLIRCPSLLEYDTEPSSQRSEDDYLPVTLRAAISITNTSEDIASKDDTNDDNPAAFPTSNSNQKTINSKKKSRTVRRSKSDKSEKRRDPHASKVSKGITTKSFHARELKTSNHEEKPATAISLKRICRSEELRKPVNRDSDKNRRRSENLHQRQSSYRREKGRQRKGNSSRDLAPRKPSSNRRPSKSTRSIVKGSSVSCKNLGSVPDDKILTKVSSVLCKNLVVDWSRQASPNEEQNERSQERLKKSSSNASNARRVRKASKAGRNSSQVLAESEECNQNADWKRRSPPQANRNKPSKEKQVSKHSEPQKMDESSPTRNKKPKSRRSMMISSKATTDSCRDLLRKIHEINNDRLSNENRRPNTIKDESHSSSVDLLSRSMDSARQNKTKKDISRSSSFRKTPKDSKEESPNTSNKSNNSGKSRRKLQDEEKRQKPHRTKSAPLVLKGKDFNGKMSRSKSSDLLPTTDVDAVQTKPKKKSLSSRLLGMLSEGKGACGSKDDETICTGNRNKDKKERKRLMRRCKSDSSLRESSQKKSGYDLMLSMHSIASHKKVEKDDTRENIQGDVESDDEDSFAASNPVKPKTLSSETSIEDAEKMLSEYTKSRPVVSGHSNDVLPMAKFSSQKVLGTNEGPISKPRRSSCLQIDFSQLSEHGTTGNIIVREKRMSAKINKPKSNRNVLA